MIGGRIVVVRKPSYISSLSPYTQLAYLYPFQAAAYVAFHCLFAVALLLSDYSLP